MGTGTRDTLDFECKVDMLKHAVAITNCSALWLATIHWIVALTRRALLRNIANLPWQNATGGFDWFWFEWLFVTLSTPAYLPFKPGFAGFLSTPSVLHTQSTSLLQGRL